MTIHIANHNSIDINPKRNALVVINIWLVLTLAAASMSDDLVPAALQMLEQLAKLALPNLNGYGAGT